jgi:hypothetical protein
MSESYSLTSDIELLEAKLEVIKEEGEKSKRRLESLEKLKTFALEENLYDVGESISEKVNETLKVYNLLKENYRLVRERRDSLPV